MCECLRMCMRYTYVNVCGSQRWRESVLLSSSLLIYLCVFIYILWILERESVCVYVHDACVYVCWCYAGTSTCICSDELVFLCIPRLMSGFLEFSLWYNEARYLVIPEVTISASVDNQHIIFSMEFLLIHSVIIRRPLCRCWESKIQLYTWAAKVWFAELPLWPYALFY